MKTPTYSSRRFDPRLYQIAVLSALLLYGVLILDLEIRPLIAATALFTVLGAQWTASRLFELPRFEPRSALISGLSLALLLRTPSMTLAAFAAVVTIFSKFLLRIDGKHVFNPTNFGLAVLLLLSDRVWVSPGQWGSLAFFAFLIAGLGGLVTYRAARGDVTWAFLAAWAMVIFGRAAWLGDPWALALHQLGNGAFLIFTFFMISDPKTTPSSRTGRVIFALLVAAVAGYIQFLLYRPNGLIWALFCCAPLVPLIDRLLPGRLYSWQEAPAAAQAADLPSPGHGLAGWSGAHLRTET